MNPDEYTSDLLQRLHNAQWVAENALVLVRVLLGILQNYSPGIGKPHTDEVLEDLERQLEATK